MKNYKSKIQTLKKYSVSLLSLILFLLISISPTSAKTLGNPYNVPFGSHDLIRFYPRPAPVPPELCDVDTEGTIYFDEVQNTILYCNASSYTSLGDPYWIKNSNSLYLDTTYINNYIGVGTTDPITDLHIKGHNPALGTDTAAHITFDNTGNTLGFTIGNDSTAFGSITYERLSGNDHAVYLNTAGLNKHITLSSTTEPRIGIGTSTPTSTVEIIDTSYSPQFKIEALNSPYGIGMSVSQSLNYDYNYGIIENYENNRLELSSSNSPEDRGVFLSADGKVGVNNTAPTSTLHISGPNDLALVGSNTVGIYGDEFSVEDLSFKTHPFEIILYDGPFHQGYPKESVILESFDGSRTYQSNISVTKAPTTALHFGHGELTDSTLDKRKITITEDGVNINEGTPTTGEPFRLYVNGDLRVKGDLCKHNPISTGCDPIVNPKLVKGSFVQNTLAGCKNSGCAISICESNSPGSCSSPIFDSNSNNGPYCTVTIETTTNNRRVWIDNDMAIPITQTTLNIESPSGSSNGKTIHYVCHES